MLDETSGFRTTRHGAVRRPLRPRPGRWSCAGRVLDPRAAQGEHGDTARPAARGMHPNAVWATNRTLRAAGDRCDERRVAAAHAQTPAPRGPRGEVVEVQEWHGTGREWESLFRDVPRRGPPVRPRRARPRDGCLGALEGATAPVQLRRPRSPLHRRTPRGRPPLRRRRRRHDPAARLAHRRELRVRRRARRKRRQRTRSRSSTARCPTSKP